MSEVYPIASLWHNFNARWLTVLGTVAAMAAPGLADTVVLPAGSEDGLAPAIASAGPGGKVIVASGLHRESASVRVEFPVCIVGEPGSILEGTTTPNADGNPPDFIDPVLHVRGTSLVKIEGLSIRPAPGALGNTAILVQDAPLTRIQRNTISDHEYGIVIQGGDHVEVLDNDVRDAPLFGILAINGRFARVSHNTVTRAGVFGIWVCDRDGRCASNSVSECFIGIMLCRFAEGDAVLPDGSATGASASSTSWLIVNNESFDNALFGYLVTDGANNNVLVSNDAWNNGGPDILLDSEFDVPLFYAPPSFENLVVLEPQSELVVIDLGVDNVIVGN